jgi:hypothetical protein
VDRLQLSLLPFSLTKLSLIIYIRKYLNGLPFRHSAGYWRCMLATGDSFWIRFCLLAQSYVLVYVLTNWGNEGASGQVIYFCTGIFPKS